MRGTIDLQDILRLIRRLNRIYTDCESDELPFEPCRNHTCVWKAWCIGNHCLRCCFVWCRNG